MTHLFRAVRHHYRERGFRGLSGEAIHYVRGRLWSENRWLIYRGVFTDRVPAILGSVVRRELGSQQLLALDYLRARAFPEEIERRFDDGNVCHGFFLGDRLVTIGWSSAGYLELDRGVHVPCEGSVGLFDFLTLEEFRSRGYYTDALRQLWSVMEDEGFSSAYIAVDPGNVASIRGIERAGFRRVSKVTRRWRFGAPVIRQEEAGAS